MEAVFVVLPSLGCCMPTLTRMAGRLVMSTTGVIPAFIFRSIVTLNRCNSSWHNFTATMIAGIFNSLHRVCPQWYPVGSALSRRRCRTLFTNSQLTSKRSLPILGSRTLAGAGTILPITTTAHHHPHPCLPTNMVFTLGLRQPPFCCSSLVGGVRLPVVQAVH